MVTAGEWPWARWPTVRGLCPVAGACGRAEPDKGLSRISALSGAGEIVAADEVVDQVDEDAATLVKALELVKGGTCRA